MKRYLLTITLFSILAILPVSIFAQNSQALSPLMKDDIDNFNQFLKTFDNGYYGYVELINGTLYVRRKDGEVIYFALSDISDVQTIREKSGQLKVAFNCRDDKECVFSGKEKYQHMTFWEKGSFADITTLRLAKSIFDRYKTETTSAAAKSDSSENNPTVAIETPKISLQSNTTVGNSPSSSSMMKANIDNFNQYLKTFDDGYYGYVELINGTLYVRHQDGKTAHFKLSDISEVKVITSATEYKVAFMCKYEKECVTIGKEKVVRMAFWKKGYYNYIELSRYTQNILDSYKNEAVAQTPGSFEDCKIILSNGCRNFFLRSTYDQVSPYIANMKNLIKLEVESDAGGGIVSVTFYSDSGFKPAENLKWKDKPKDVIAKYGKPIRTTDRDEGGEYDVYPDFQINYFRQEQIYSIKLARERTPRELAALKARETIANSPEVLAKSLQAEYDALVRKINSDVYEANIMVAEFNNIKASGVGFIDSGRLARQIDLRKKVDEIKRELSTAIEKFLKKYKSVVREDMRLQLLASQEKFKPMSN